MDDKEKKRKCFKCGASPAVDGVKLFRFTRPGVRNLLRCELWAKYVFPENVCLSIPFLGKLFTEHRMLCQRHFKDTDFTDSSKKRLITYAVPSDIKDALPIYTPEQPGPSNSTPLSSLNLNTEPGSSEVKQNATKMSPNEINLYKKCRKYMQQICVLKNKTKALKAKALLDSISEDDAVKKLSTKITPSFALLLQGQLRNCKRKLRGHRWSKEEKLTALRIYKRSPTCYRLLRRLFSLPSPSTLKSLLSKIEMHVGCNKPVFDLLEKFRKSQLPQDNAYVLMFDEMSLKKHVSYNAKDDLIEGYQDHGSQGRTKDIAGYALVFMICGIRKRIKQPIAHYFSSGFCTADRLAVIIKEVLHACFEAGLNIAATVCDMDGVNRKALSILGASIDHPYITVNEKDIVTTYDTPHLLKCFRNLFIKYDIECDTDINSENKTGRGVAKWKHIEEFHKVDSMNTNFVYAPCLKKDHLNPNAKQKMKVNLAAQVLSHSVAAGMFSKISEGTLTAEAVVTANVVANIDKLFDLLNSDSADCRRGKPHATNLTANSPHLDFFLKMKRFFTNLKFIGSARKPPSQEGWIWHLNAIERLWRNLKKMNQTEENQTNQIKSLATRRIQQDPLENLFGVIRGNCGCNTNPTCGQFVAGLKTAILSNLSHLGTTGNCETDNNIVINNFETMLSSQPKKKDAPTETTPGTSSAAQQLSSSVEILPLEIEEALKENTGEIQACAYVCGFILKQLPVNDCETCSSIFVSNSIDKYHNFVDFKEYSDFKRSLNYASKDMIASVEFCATLVNNYLNEKPQINFLMKNVTDFVLSQAGFQYIHCAIHKENTINILIKSIFMICVNRFCILKNRSFAEEASALKLKKKMNIILHK